MSALSSQSPAVAATLGTGLRKLSGGFDLLTVNLEDYFHAGVFHRYISPDNWNRFESRLQSSTDETLSMLAAHGARATFFVLGWIAERHPELIRRIDAEGHEIASRGFLHQPLLKLPRRARHQDLLRSKHVLEDTIGKEVIGFRLSDGWLRRSDLGFLDDVLEAGYLYDSSLMPKKREFSGEPWRRLIHEHACSNGGKLIEVPPSTIPVAQSWLPIAGGNYLRQLPEQLMQNAVRKWRQTETAPFVMYFQTWELDDQQPKLSVVSRLTRIRHYRNLGKYRTLLPRYLSSGSFVSLRDHAELDGSPLADLRGHTGRIEKSTAVLQDNERDSVQSSCTDTENRRPAVRNALSLVIPCYNEEATLPYLYRTIQSLKQTLSRNWDLQVVFVDDCSRDQTLATLRTLFAEDSGVCILQHETNKGVSAGILTGMKAASGEIVASIDADCSYDPHELARMLPLMTSDVAMVTASPYHPDGHVCNVPGWRLLLSHTLSMMYRILLRQQLRTWTSCFRVYRREQILDLPLQESGFLGTAELAAQLCLHGRKIVEHPATLSVRLFGCSKMKTLRTILAHLRLLLRITVSLCAGQKRDPSSGTAKKQFVQELSTAPSERGQES